MVAALAAVLVFHLPALLAPFQYDDFHHLADNPAIVGLAGIPQLWADPNTYSAIPGAAGLYRPLLMTSHALTVAFFGRGPFGFHLVNLLLHLLNVGLVYSLFRKWGASSRAAAMAAAFFGLAAVNQETVAYAAARSTLLASAFGLAAVRIAEGKASGIRAAACGLCLLLALWSKEIAAVVPAFLAIRDLTVGKPGAFRERAPYYAAAMAALAVYMTARLSMVPALPETYTGRWGYFGGQGRVIVYYLAKSLWPVGLTIYRGLPVSGGAALDLLGWVALLAPAAAALWFRKRLGLAGLGWLWFLAGFAVTSSVFPLILTSSLERVYLPSLGLAAIGLEVWRRGFADTGRSRTGAGLFAAVVLLNGLVTFGLHREWTSAEAMWRRAVRTAPDAGMTWLWLGRTEVEAGLLDRAESRLRRALALEPDDAYTQMAMADLLQRTGREEGARSIWSRALRSGGPGEALQLESLLGLAGLDLNAGRLEEARIKALRALEYYPDSPDANFIAGAIASRMGDLIAAESLLRRALELSPGHPRVSSELGRVMLRKGKIDRARDLLRAAEAGGADDADTLAGLGIVAMNDQRIEDAGEKFRRALEKDPKNHFALMGSALLAAGGGRFEEALGFADQAVNLNPESVELRELRARFRLDQARATKDGEERTRILEQARPDVDWLEAKGMNERKKQWLELAGK